MYDKLGINAFCYYRTSFIVSGGPCNQENLLIFLSLQVWHVVSEIHFVAVYNSAVMEFYHSRSSEEQNSSYILRLFYVYVICLLCV